MFIYATTLKRCLLWLAGIVFCAILIFAVYRLSTPRDMRKHFYHPAKTTEEQTAFLAQFGCQVRPEPVEQSEVRIPEAFDTVYETYEDIINRDGYSLLPYRGKVIMRYTYLVTNHRESANQDVYANLLVDDGKIVGGDICSRALNGFMQSFSEFVPAPPQS